MKKWIEDIKDEIEWRIKDIRYNVISFIEGLKRWFSYYNVLRHVYDFDFSSILEVERSQTERVRDAIMKYQNHVEWERDVKHINLALKLLDIIEENGCAKRIGPELRFEPYKDDLYKVLDDPDSRYVLPIYVNTSNSERFCKIPKDKFEDPRIGPLMKDHLRIEKAWYLYHKLRTYHMRSWWD